VVVASEPSLTWSRVFDDGAHSALLDMALIDQRSILAVGAANHRQMPPYSGDALLMAFDLDGNTLRERPWGGDGYEQA